MVIEKTYPEEEPPIASYNYVDVEEGTGVVTYYGYQANASGAVTLHLTRNVIYSYLITQQLIDGTNYDFDLSSFNTPKTCKGTAILRFSWEVGTGSGDNWFTCYLIRVDKNNNETIIGEVDGWPTARAGTLQYKNHVYPIDLTETHFKAGETLRLRMFFKGTTSALGTDPANRLPSAKPNWTAEHPTKLELFMPFRLEL